MNYMSQRPPVVTYPAGSDEALGPRVESIGLDAEGAYILCKDDTGSSKRANDLVPMLRKQLRFATDDAKPTVEVRTASGGTVRIEISPSAAMQSVLARTAAVLAGSGEISRVVADNIISQELRRTQQTIADAGLVSVEVSRRIRTQKGRPELGVTHITNHYNTSPINSIVEIADKDNKGDVHVSFTNTASPDNAKKLLDCLPAQLKKMSLVTFSATDIELKTPASLSDVLMAAVQAELLAQETARSIALEVAKEKAVFLQQEAHKASLVGHAGSQGLAR